MLKLLKNNFKITNDCIILATPLIIFLSIISWYFNYAKDAIDNIPKLLLAIITMIVIISGSSSAWFYMVKKTIKLANTVFIFDKDRTKAFQDLLKSLHLGIGKLFLPFLGIISIVSLIYIAILFIITLIVNKYIGTIDTNLLSTINVLLSSDELIQEINDLPTEQIMFITIWYGITYLSTLVLSFFTMLWIPEVVYCEKNPFKALKYSIKKIIHTFPKTFTLFAYINVLAILISILNTILMFHPITYFLVLVLYYYFIVYIVVLLFSYYEQTFIKNEE